MKKYKKEVKKIYKIITAINNPNLNNKLNLENNIEIVCKDLQYKDAILDVLNKNINVDIIIINYEIPSEINDDELIKKIKEKNEKIRIIYILEKLNKKIQDILEKNNIDEIYFNNEININKIIEIINYENLNRNNLENNNEVNSNEEIKKELLELKKLIYENNNSLKLNNKFLENNEKNLNNDYREKNNKLLKKYNSISEENLNNYYKKNLIKKKNFIIKIKKFFIKKINKNKLNREKNNFQENKIITISGPPNVGKTNFIINFYKIIKNKKILIIDFDFYKKDIKLFLGLKKSYKINKKIKKENNNYLLSKIKNNYNNKLNNNYSEKLIYNNLENNDSENAFNNYLNKINLEKNIDLISVKELLKNNFNNINFDYFEFKRFIQDLFNNEKNNYDLILIDLGSENNPQINNLIFEKSDINILLTEGNLIGINKLNLFLNRFNKINNLKIIINKKDLFCIDSIFLEKLFKFEIIGQIKYKKFYSNLINSHFNFYYNFKNNYKKEYEKIYNKLEIRG